MKIKTIDYRFMNYTSGHGVDLGDRLDPDEEDEVACGSRSWSSSPKAPHNSTPSLK